MAPKSRLVCFQCSTILEWDGLARLEENFACSKCNSLGPFRVVRGNDCQVRMSRYNELLRRAEAV